jgi:hypothetical protein
MKEKKSTKTILLIINTIICALAIAQYYPSTISTLQQHIFSSSHNTLTRKKKKTFEENIISKCGHLNHHNIQTCEMQARPQNIRIPLTNVVG